MLKKVETMQVGRRLGLEECWGNENRSTRFGEITTMETVG